MADVWVGIDGGGSRTRVAVVDREGCLHGYGERAGCNPDWIPAEECREHLSQAVRDAMDAAGAVRDDVAGVVAGISGIDRPDDQEWAHEFVENAGLPPPSACVNDRKLAQKAALLGRPGVVVVAGTGMTTSAITETGREVLAWSFGDGGAPGAIILMRDVLARLAAEEVGDGDAAFQESMFRALDVPDAAGLRDLLLGDNLSLPAMARLAPMVTEAAEQGVPLAKALCEDAAESAVRGIRLVGGCVTAPSVPVVLIGGVVRSAAIRTRVESLLAANPKGLILEEPLLPPVGGAVLMALKPHPPTAPDRVVHRLGDSLFRVCAP